MLRTQHALLAPEAEIRPATPDDEECVRSFLTNLSLHTQTLRFFAGLTRPSASMLRALLTVNDSRDALLAVIPGTGEVVGHAMSIKGENVVEIAIVVADDWQGRGYGSRLMDALLRRARARGADTISMDVMGENRRILAIVRRRWPEARVRLSAGNFEITAAL